MKNLVLFGMQGSGKGTQGKILAEKFGFEIFETGAELRKLIASESELGLRIKAIVERGDLVSNEIVMEIIANFLDTIDSDAPVIFDGIPRSMPQKETFDALLEQKERELQAIFIEMSEEEAIQRMLERGRNDDNEAAIQKRFANYRSETVPVIEAYENAGMLTRVNGLQSIDAVAAEMESVVK